MQSPPLWLKASLALAVLALLAGGAWFYRAQGQAVSEQIEAELLAIARLKADQIAAWRAERLGGDAVLSDSPFFTKGCFAGRPTPSQGSPRKFSHASVAYKSIINIMSCCWWTLTGGCP